MGTLPKILAKKDNDTPTGGFGDEDNESSTRDSDGKK